MARKILRGEIYWADLNPTQGNEKSEIGPVLVISHGSFNNNSKMAIVMAITSKKSKAGYPLILELNSPELPQKSWVKTTQVRAIATSRIKSKIGSIDRVQLDKIITALNEVIN